MSGWASRVHLSAAGLQPMVTRWKTQMPRGAFWTYLCAAAFFNCGFSVFYFLFNLYLLGLGTTERTLGVIGSCSAVGGIVATIPAGLLAERFGLRLTLGSGVLLTVVFSILRVSLVSPSAQIMLAVLTGAAICTWGVCLSPVVAALTTEEQRPLAFSIVIASGIGVGALGGLAASRLPQWLSHLFAGSLRSVLDGEREALLCSCALASLGLIPIALLRIRRHNTRVRFVRPSGAFLARFLPAMAVWGLVTSAFPPFASVYFVHHLNISLQSMGSLFTISQLVQLVAIVAAPLLFTRTGLTAGIISTQVVTGLSLLLLACTHNPRLASQLYWAYMAAQYMNEPGIYSLLMDMVPIEDRSGASAYMRFVAAGSSIVASTLTGASITRFGYPATLYALACLAGMSAILLHRASRAKGAPAPVEFDGSSSNVTSLS